MLRLLFKLLILGGVIAVLLFFLVFNEHERSFPNLPVGAYVGHASGLVGNRKKLTTIYAERIQGGDTLLFVVFEQGWKPQAMALIALQQNIPNGHEVTQYQPVTLEHEKKKFVFSGTQKNKNEFSGRVFGSDDSRGEWSIRPVSAKELGQETTGLNTNEDVKTWMGAKAQYVHVKMQLEEALATYSSKQEKAKKLQTFIDNEDLLRQKARTERDLIAHETQEAAKERKKNADAIAHLVDELDLLARITKQGKAITLARKVTNRENKWYLAHWKTEEDTSGLEELVGENVQVDLTKLDTAYRHANEVRSLSREIAEHEQRIRELETLRDNGGSLPSQPVEKMGSERNQPTKPERPPSENRREESFWGRIFG